MSKKQEPQRRRSLNDRLDAELANSDTITVAGITTESSQNVQDVAAQAELVTKKATTIMPKEVFNALQRYCIDTETPKHRAIYRFLIDGLHAAKVITDSDYRRYQDMAAQLTTTYEKK